MIKKHLKTCFIILVAVFSCSSVMADEYSKFQIFVRTGPIEGSYEGTFEDDFEVTLAFDIGAEYFIKPDGSVIVRFIQALDTNSVPFYVYTGSGMKYYYWGRNSFNVQSESGTQISARPKLRAYVGAELGVAQVIVKTFGDILQSVASMAEFGLNTGMIYQVNDKIGLEAHVGGTLGYGISSTDANGHTIRALAGVTYFF